MNRFVITALVIGIVSGCAGASPGPTSMPSAAATASSAATAMPSPIPSPAPTPKSPNPSPTAMQASRALPTADKVEPGRYFLEFDGYRFTFTVAKSGWSGSVDWGGVFQGPDSELAVFWPGGSMPHLYRRACESSGTEFDPGPSVDDLANALASLQDFEATAPADVTVSSYTGKRVALTVPIDVDVRGTTCDQEKYSLNSGRWYQASGQTDDMNVLDLDGVRQLVTVSHTPGTPSDIAAQLEAMLASLEIAPI